MRAWNHCPWCGSGLETKTLGGADRRACPAEGCGFVHWDNPVPVVAALVLHEGQVVLARSKGWPEGMYGLVAGFLERGESPEGGAVREVAEELGLTGRATDFLGALPFPRMNQVILAYEVRAEGELVVGEELAGVKRVSPDRLRAWDQGTGPAVAEWLRRRAAGAGS